MPSKKSTTVVLNKKVQHLKDELAAVYGLKNLLSAGILRFSRLTDSEQKDTIKEINQMEQMDDAAEDAAEQIYKKLKQHFLAETGGSKTLLAPPDKIVKMITDFRRLHSP